MLGGLPFSKVNSFRNFMRFHINQKTSKYMFWSEVRLEMFKAKLWICILLLQHFIISWVARLSVYQKIYLFSNCLIEEGKENQIASNSHQVELYVFFLNQWDFCNNNFSFPLIENAGNSRINWVWINVEQRNVVTINYFVVIFHEVEFPK